MRSHRLRAAAASQGLDDSAYSGFFTTGASPISIVNTSVDFFQGYSGNTHNGKGVFYDHSEGKIFASWNTVSSYAWSNGGSTYSGNANLYQPSGSQTNLAGHSSSGIGSTGSDITVAYLGDNTPVFVAVSASNARFYYFNYPSGTYIGYQDFTTGTTNNPNSVDTRGVCYSGTHILTFNASDFAIFGYDLPANTASISSNTISTTRKWSSGNNAVNGYGLVWIGNGVIQGYSNSYYPISHFGATEMVLSGSGYTGTHSQNAWYYITSSGSGVANYSIGMDYKNRKLILGGYDNDRHAVYGE
tara:strand:- start:494 stop:1396 length:903 start_codon:yes stop_codon:yes gene_type:complete